MFIKYSNILTFIAFACLFGGRAGAQTLPPVTDLSTGHRIQYQYPWAGGMNSCQFNKLDIDLDGIKDLIVFDRAGDRIMPFVVVQSGADYDYRYAPEYTANFPELTHWAVFADYNLDGKEDIFTYSPGFAGLKVYRNVSETYLDFRLEVFPFLTSFQGGGYVNILVTYADYPAITDLDGDGDLDILTFYGLGSFVEKHTNMSMDNYGHADSLNYVKTEFCWGYFAESEESNDLALDTCLRCAMGEREKRGQGDGGARHTGSTFSIQDLNGDGLPDLLLGDVDYPNLVALYNSGNLDTARMLSYDWEFPPDDKAVHLFSMPAAFYEDFDFDGTKDLLVSPFDPNPFLTNNFRSSWFYHNDGNNSNPQFKFYSSSFLQNRMIDLGAGAYPVFYDFDSDGVSDLIVGNYGYYDTSYMDEFLILHTEQTGKLAYFSNTGDMQSPSFNFTNRDFAVVSTLDLTGIVPAFADLDGDGDADMLLGSETGQLVLYLNKTDGQGIPQMEFTQNNYAGIDVGAYSAPCLFDLDNDNLPDLIIGEKAGNLNYYRNTGSLSNPQYTLVTDSLGKINVTDPAVSLDGYSVPCFYRDGAGNTHLLVGSEQGIVFYYTGIDDNLAGPFYQSDTLASLLGLDQLKEDMGYRSAPALNDLDNDGYPELICGNFSGGLEYFGKNAGTPVSQVHENHETASLPIFVYPVPAKDIINIEFPANANCESILIQIYDLSGSLIYSSIDHYSALKVIQVSEFPRGTYFLRVEMLEKQGTDCVSDYFKIIII